LNGRPPLNARYFDTPSDRVSLGGEAASFSRPSSCLIP
jgi:hypothetical protein